MLLLFITTATALAWLTSPSHRHPTDVQSRCRILKGDPVGLRELGRKHRPLRRTEVPAVDVGRGAVLGESSRTGGARSNSAQALKRVRPSTNHPPPTTTGKTHAVGPDVVSHLRVFVRGNIRKPRAATGWISYSRPAIVTRVSVSVHHAPPLNWVALRERTITPTPEVRTQEHLLVAIYMAAKRHYVYVHSLHEAALLPVRTYVRSVPFMRPESA